MEAMGTSIKEVTAREVRSARLGGTLDVLEGGVGEADGGDGIEEKEVKSIESRRDELRRRVWV